MVHDSDSEGGHDGRNGMSDCPICGKPWIEHPQAVINPISGQLQRKEQDMRIIDRGSYETADGDILRFEHQEDQRGHDRFVCRDTKGFTLVTSDDPQESFAEFIGATITTFLSTTATVGKASR
jgi:hypothetical protein